MDNNLKTRTISFKNMNIENDESLYVKPENRFENLTTHQINTLKVNTEGYVNAEDNSFTRYRIQQQEKLKESKLQKTNIYYSYFPKFYLKELSYAKSSAILYTTFFSLFITGAIILASLVLTIWKNSVNPHILLLLLIPFTFFFIKLIFAINRYKNFYTEAKTINFRDEKVLSSNIQKIYRKLKTNYIDINWFCVGIYIAALIIMLVDSLLPIFIYKAGFADFTTPINVDNQYTYMILFWTCVGFITYTLISHVSVLVLDYIRTANIENFYNYMLIDAAEISNIKKAKNRRDAIIFFAIILTIVFLVWIIFRLIKRKQATKVVVK